MGYNSSTGIISGSVSHSDINAALGTAYKTNRQLCTAGAIKPLAKYKPVHNSSNDPLTEAQRRGTGENGIWYGVKAGVPNGNLYYAHNANWAYDGRPTGGIGLSPYRLQDFNGYNKNAVLVFRGEGISSGATVEYGSPNLTALLWYSDNPYGIDVTEIVNGAGAKGSSYWANMSVYIVIDNYATIMSPNRLWYNSALQNRFTCPALPSALRNTATRKVTIVVGPYDSSMNGTWKSYSSSTVASGAFASIYGLVNMSINFASTSIVIVTNFSGSISGNRITYSWSQGSNWGSYSYKRLSISVRQTNTGAQGSAATPYTITMSGTSANAIVTDILNHYGFLEYSGSGNSYEITAMVQYSNNGSDWNNYTSTTNTISY